MSFEINDRLMRSLCARNFFQVPEDGMVFFGFRGCLPADPEDFSFAKTRTLSLAEVNYENPRCTIGQWLPAKKLLAVYPGSTCPNEDCVRAARGKGGQGANQLLTGYYTFVKGMHKSGEDSGHQAFRQEETRVVLRNVDDMDFDGHDTADEDNPFDNLHCAFSASVSRGYSSAGCQVVVGFPNRNDRKTTESGPWASFRQTAYKLDQQSFRYILLHGAEVAAMAENPDLMRPAQVRFGSHAEAVRGAQKRLRELGRITFDPDADCGPRTQLAIIRFQVDQMGPENADGILGTNTATQLGLTDWPMIGKTGQTGPDGRRVRLRAGVGGLMPADRAGQGKASLAAANKLAAAAPDGRFVKTLVNVFNRGIPPLGFLQELVAWGKTAPEEIFVDQPGNTKDVYASVITELGPFKNITHRKACMLEVMRVLAGFESSWNWNEGIDTSRKSEDTAENSEAGAWQVSSDSLSIGQDLKDLVKREVGTLNGLEFQRAMKANHPLAMEYIARLMRHTRMANGPLYKGDERSKLNPKVRDEKQSIYPWLSRDAVAEFQAFLSQAAPKPKRQKTVRSKSKPRSRASKRIV
jgi:peptidoglycan hydrolase-like protein with peptidoglycan-binding domain